MDEHIRHPFYILGIYKHDQIFSRTLHNDSTPVIILISIAVLHHLMVVEGKSSHLTPNAINMTLYVHTKILFATPKLINPLNTCQCTSQFKATPVHRLFICTVSKQEVFKCSFPKCSLKRKRGHSWDQHKGTTGTGLEAGHRHMYVSPTIYLPLCKAE